MGNFLKEKDWPFRGKFFLSVVYPILEGKSITSRQAIMKSQKLFPFLIIVEKHVLDPIPRKPIEHATLLQRLSNVVQTSITFGQRSIDVVLTSCVDCKSF